MILYDSPYYGVTAIGESIEHSGTKGMKWHHRRWQNEDGSLTPAGREHYGVGKARNKAKTDKSSKSLTKSEKEQKAKKELASLDKAIKYLEDGTDNFSERDFNQAIKIDRQFEKIFRDGVTKKDKKLRQSIDTYFDAREKYYTLQEKFRKENPEPKHGILYNKEKHKQKVQAHYDKFHNSEEFKSALSKVQSEAANVSKQILKRMGYETTDTNVEAMRRILADK